VVETQTIKALEGELAGLREALAEARARAGAAETQLAAAEARIERQAAGFAERDAERLADLAAEKAAFAAKEAALAGDLAAERARTEKAIEAFASLAERLDALAAERSRRPWWRRLAGRTS
jgi:chromosome segregation ATPase